ncbi:hypothetical protein L2Y96_03390 [Luteibacter aegosomaticola]|uniref:hypothetical protein n=1 Tax=Luteibacter aegosomaticola TaxID=2911538 RepID=UPI001FF7C5AC|nr:hypothetical protein [Luteibacter aegosomaticola]UPG90831.1 hypothetical protein L2Y96_03390 [Luteibacter aegosomaticola]
MADSVVRPYKAIVWTSEPDAVGVRREILATSLDDANAQLVAEFGEDCTMTLWNEEDAERPR